MDAEMEAKEVHIGPESESGDAGIPSNRLQGMGVASGVTLFGPALEEPVTGLVFRSMVGPTEEKTR
jgi:hypothetical protein